MPALNKFELLTITRKEYSKLHTLIVDLDPEKAMIKDADGVSIKDIVGHRAHWIDMFLGWYAKGQAGIDVEFPAPGYKWNELLRFNADLRVKQADMSWAEACAMLESRYMDLTVLLDTLDARVLYRGPMKGAKNGWTIGRWAEAAGASHFRSASKYIRARLRSMG